MNERYMRFDDADEKSMVPHYPHLSISLSWSVEFYIARAMTLDQYRPLLSMSGAG